MQRSKDWLREAEAELEAAHVLRDSGHWAWCCFTCQQAAEKALKAVCDFYRTPQLGHNLNMLLAAVSEHVTAEEPLQVACARLNRLYIPTRYPDAFDEGAPADQFFERDAQQAVEDAERIIQFAANVIRPAENKTD